MEFQPNKMKLLQLFSNWMEKVDAKSKYQLHAICID